MPHLHKALSLAAIVMRHLLTILTLTLLFSCKTEYRKVIDSYPNGKVKTENIYPDKNDKLKYTIIKYFEDGQISFKGIVENKKFVDLKLNYFENGNSKQVDSIIKPCDLDFCCCDGKVLKYYSNGKLDQTFENRNGVANGVVTLYDNDSSGKIVSIFNYKNDKKNGNFKTYYETGKLYKTGTYNNDTLVDHIYYFEENGDSMKIYYTWKGEEDFPTKKWLDNGQIFYATYLDSTYSKALYLWTDKSGNELKRDVVTASKGKAWVTPN